MILMVVLAEHKRNERKKGGREGYVRQRVGGILLDPDRGGTLLGHSVCCVVFTTLTVIPGDFCFECQKLLTKPWPWLEMVE